MTPPNSTTTAQIIALLKPYLPYGVAVFLLWALNKAIGETLPNMLAGGWDEIKSLLTAQTNAKSANMLLVIVLALLILLLFWSPLSDLVLPEAKTDYYMVGVYIFLIVFFAGVGMYSIKLTRLDT